MNDDAMLTTRQAAKVLGVNDSRVRQLARSGALKATRVGRDWLIRQGDLAEAAARKTAPGPTKGQVKRAPRQLNGAERRAD